MVNDDPNQRPDLSEINRFFKNYKKYKLHHPNELGEVLFQKDESD